MRELTPAVEDYLKAIYEVDEGSAGAPAGTAVLADKLGVTRAPPTGTLQKLSAPPPGRRLGSATAVCRFPGRSVLPIWRWEQRRSWLAFPTAAPTCCATSTGSACALPAGFASWSADRSTGRCMSKPSTRARSCP